MHIEVNENNFRESNSIIFLPPFKYGSSDKKKSCSYRNRFFLLLVLDPFLGRAFLSRKVKRKSQKLFPFESWQKIIDMYRYTLKTGLLCRGSGSQHIAMLPAQEKV